MPLVRIHDELRRHTEFLERMPELEHRAGEASTPRSPGRSTSAFAQCSHTESPRRTYTRQDRRRPMHRSTPERAIGILAMLDDAWTGHFTFDDTAVHILSRKQRSDLARVRLAWSSRAIACSTTSLSPRTSTCRSPARQGTGPRRRLRAPDFDRATRSCHRDSALVAARTVFQKARIELDRALGRTLDANRISIESARAGSSTTSPQP